MNIIQWSESCVLSKDEDEILLRTASPKVINEMILPLIFHEIKANPGLNTSVGHILEALNLSLYFLRFEKGIKYSFEDIIKTLELRSLISIYKNRDKYSYNLEYQAQCKRLKVYIDSIFRVKPYDLDDNRVMILPINHAKHRERMMPLILTIEKLEKGCKK